MFYFFMAFYMTMLFVEWHTAQRETHHIQPKKKLEKRGRIGWRLCSKWKASFHDDNPSAQNEITKENREWVCLYYSGVQTIDGGSSVRIVTLSNESFLFTL